MNKLCSVSAVALAVAMGAAPSQARPTDQEIAAARGRLAPKVTDSRYMRLDQPAMKACSPYPDGGENRFDRMYDSIDASNCSPRR